MRKRVVIVVAYRGMRPIVGIVATAARPVIIYRPVKRMKKCLKNQIRFSFYLYRRWL
jgi:hypothetical protein